MDPPPHLPGQQNSPKLPKAKCGAVLFSSIRFISVLALLLG